MACDIAWTWNVSKDPSVQGFVLLLGGGGAFKKWGLGGLKSLEDLPLKQIA